MPLSTLPNFDFSGHSYSGAELQLIAEVIGDFPALTVTGLSNTLCELLEWKRPNGKLKYEECRALLEHLQAEGVVSLPALRKNLSAWPTPDSRHFLQRPPESFDRELVRLPALVASSGPCRGYFQKRTF